VIAVRDGERNPARRPPAPPTDRYGAVVATGRGFTTRVRPTTGRRAA
jgi:hypothetical protein